MVELLEGPGPRVGHRRARALQRAQQLARRVGIEVGRAKAARISASRRSSTAGRCAGRRPGAEQVGQQPLVHVGPPRQAGRSSRRPRARRTTRRRAAGRAGPRSADARDGRLLALVLGDRIQPVGRIVEREQRVLGDRDGLQRVPAGRVPADEERLVDERRPPQDGVASRRSVHRSTRTPASSSAGYHRVVSSHTQRTGVASRSRTKPAAPRRPPGSPRPGPAVVVVLPGLHVRAAAHEEDAVHRTPVSPTGPTGLAPCRGSP